MAVFLDTANSLLTLTEVKSYLGDTGSDYEDRYKRLINAVSHTFNRETNRLLKEREVTEYRDGDGGTEIDLRQYPITSDTTSIDIRIDTDRAYSTGDKVGSTSITLYEDIGRVAMDDNSFDKGVQSVKIVYRAGYTIDSSGTTSGASSASTGTLPYDIQYSALDMVRYLLNRETDNLIGIRTLAAEGRSISIETDMPWSVVKTLDKYKDKRFGR